jgi:hypothetical protein
MVRDGIFETAGSIVTVILVFNEAMGLRRTRSNGFCPTTLVFVMISLGAERLSCTRVRRLRH